MTISPAQIKTLLSQAKDLKISGVSYKYDKYFIANGNLNCYCDNNGCIIFYLKSTIVASGIDKIYWEPLSNIATIKNMLYCEIRRIEDEIEQKLMASSDSTSLEVVRSGTLAEIEPQTPIFLYFSCLVCPIALSFLVFSNLIVFVPLVIAMLASLHVARIIHKKQLKELKESTIEAQSILLDKNLEDINKILEAK